MVAFVGNGLKNYQNTRAQCYVEQQSLSCRSAFAQVNDSPGSYRTAAVQLLGSCCNGQNFISCPITVRVLPNLSQNLHEFYTLAGRSLRVQHSCSIFDKVADHANGCPKNKRSAYFPWSLPTHRSTFVVHGFPQLRLDDVLRICPRILRIGSRAAVAFKIVYV